MLPLFEMFMKANGGDAINKMAAQFGLSPEQVQSAWEALLPAFSIGLKRNATDASGMGALMQAMLSGGHANAFDNVANAFNPAGTQAGNDILGQLFGSKDVSRAVAAQAAQATGIGQDILKQMLPAMASMMAGGMQQQFSGALGAAGLGAGGNVFGKVIEEMMKQAGGNAQPQQQAPQSSGNPWGDILGQILTGGQAPQAPAPSGNSSSNPWGDVLDQIMKVGKPQPQQAPRPAPSGNPLEDLLKGMFGTQPQADAEPEEEAAPQPHRRTQQAPSNNPWGDMFETGRKTQDSYNKGLEDIFDGFLKGMDRNR